MTTHHPFYSGRSGTPTSDVVWYRVPTPLITEEGYNLIFQYYDHDISIIIKQTGEVKVSFFSQHTYPPGVHSTLWVDQEEPPSYVHKFSNDSKVEYTHSETLNLDQKFLLIGFYIYL